MLNKVLAGKKIAVTGATGFLGRHLVPVLVNSGAIVTCLVRKKANKAYLPESVKIIEGDCSNATSLEPFLNNQNIIIHAAGTLFGNSWNNYLSGNAKFAYNIANAKPPKQLEKVIFVSSLAASAPSDILPGIRETDTPSPVSAYGWSKLMAENILRAAFGEKLAILRPSIIYGSGDKGLLPLFKSIKNGIGISPGFNREFPVSAIHAKDAARAIILACAKNTSGIYNLSDGNAYAMSFFCKEIANAMNKKAPAILKMPLSIMAFSAFLSGFASLVMQYGAKVFKLGQPGPASWNMDKYREASQCGWLADTSRIRKELDFSPLYDLSAGLEETVRGYVKEGWL